MMNNNENDVDPEMPIFLSVRIARPHFGSRSTEDSGQARGSG